MDVGQQRVYLIEQWAAARIVAGDNAEFGVTKYAVFNRLNHCAMTSTTTRRRDESVTPHRENVTNPYWATRALLNLPSFAKETTSDVVN